ncbi:hypothetical protein Ancab_035638 [Ancistrocladus abbreviatus]
MKATAPRKDPMMDSTPGFIRWESPSSLHLTSDLCGRGFWSLADMCRQRCGSLGEEISTLKQQNVEDLTNMSVSNAMSANRSSMQLSRLFFSNIACSCIFECDMLDKSSLWLFEFHIRQWKGATFAVGSSVGTVGSGIRAGLGATVGIV